MPGLAGRHPLVSAVHRQHGLQMERAVATEREDKRLAGWSEFRVDEGDAAAPDRVRAVRPRRLSDCKSPAAVPQDPRLDSRMQVLWV